MSDEIAGLKNLGPQTAAWLETVGITTTEQLRRLGTLAACERLLSAGIRVSAIMAYAIEGALTDRDWRQLPDETRRELKAEFLRLKRALTAR